MTWYILLIINLTIVAWNVVNSRLDAYLILKAQQSNIAKSIKHGVNFGLYLAFVVGLKFLFHIPLPIFWIFLFCSFPCRQITFDISLNLRRGLSAFYVSLDRPPKAIMDRIEVKIFGYNGKTPVIVYSIFWLAAVLGQVAAYNHWTIL